MRLISKEESSLNTYEVSLQTNTAGHPNLALPSFFTAAWELTRHKWDQRTLGKARVKVQVDKHTRHVWP